MQIENQKIIECLGDHGEFAAANENFKSRPVQQEMAVAVNEAIQSQSNLVIEAGTGVGKTFAYLLPALLSGKQLVISTGTKNLQDQLFKRDLPNILKILKLNPKTALLKGRNNYLCLYRLENTLASGRLPDPIAVKHLGIVNRWRDKTVTGDLGDLSVLPEKSSVIPLVTSTVENCLSQDCPYIDECHLSAAREKARKAKVLVVNHHILLADLVLKEDGFGELLPDTDIFIVDEAHHLGKTAYQFYGSAITSRQINELCKEVELEYRTQVTDCRDLLLESERLAKQVKEFRLALPDFDIKEEWRNQPARDEALLELHNKINTLFDIVKVNSTRTKVLESCFERLVSIKHVLEGFLEQATSRESRINWYETNRNSFRLNSTPLDVAELFQTSRNRYANSSWVLTSATLSVNGSFEHYIKELGWSDVHNKQLPSSFDYPNQAMLYVPRNLPSPNNQQHTSAVIQNVLPLLKVTHGRAFLLFTSHRALRQAAEKLREYDTFNCLVQGEASKEELLQRFVEEDNSVLIATGSFWEGVDVSGYNLALVVIDKLPFAAPDDPILNAKITRCRESKGNPFYELQIPDAVLTLKQGVGRLIRSVDDKGVVCLCDPRIVGKDYGGLFVNSLPAMTRTREEGKVIDFLAEYINDSVNLEVEREELNE
ncbi:MAG: ATP-dependent DNA helicase [Kangiellaceae bacterium]|nr:ATP-dependent DNA helicase [Kangiellaceae bacterium]